jgi:tRNA dimethylallyltransferase
LSHLSDLPTITSASLEGLIPLEERIRDITSIRAKKVILLAGPTASGKTSLSLRLARLLGGEIVSADSMQVYCGMDIGTAKVSEEERASIPHHLIDIRHVHESFNVVDFYHEAKAALNSIASRNRVPIVVGGTGFYFSALLYGPPSGPPSVPEVRRQFEEQLEQFGCEALYDKLLQTDPEYAKTITHNDKHKIIRALEIVIVTGERVSSHQWKRQRVRSEYQFFPWFIYRPREILYPMIDERCEAMMEAGFIEEVEVLKEQGLLLNSSARQAIGYRQCLEYLESERTEEDFKRFLEHFKIASRHLAKRQFTWFRKEPLFRWLNLGIHDEEIAAEMIAQEYLSSQ